MRRLLLSSLFTISTAFGGSIAPDIWYSFMWNPTIEGSTAGIAANPGPMPWTITTAATTYLAVTDGYLPGDQFQVFDGANLLGLTNLVASGSPTGCVGGDTPENCFADPRLSKSVFTLPAGSHSISVGISVDIFGSGAGFFGVFTTNPLAGPPPPPTSGGSGEIAPEPATFWLAGLMAAALLWSRRAPRQAAVRVK